MFSLGNSYTAFKATNVLLLCFVIWLCVVSSLLLFLPSPKNFENTQPLLLCLFFVSVRGARCLLCDKEGRGYREHLEQKMICCPSVQELDLVLHYSNRYCTVF